MGLDTIHLRAYLSVSPYLDQGSLGTQGEHHRRRRDRCRAFVPWHLLAMGREIQAHLPLQETGDQQADDGAPRQGGEPCGLREPPRSESRGGLAPPKPRVDRGRVVWIRREQLGIWPLCRAHRRGADRPALVFLGMTPPLDRPHQALPCRGRGWVGLRWPSAPGAARAAALGPAALAARVRPPRARRAAPPAPPPAPPPRAGG